MTYLECVAMCLSLPQVLQALIELFRGISEDHFVVVLVDDRLLGRREGGREGRREGGKEGGP